ncbi:MAG: beta-ketoacyl-ACP synthase III [Pseudomonadota bacterium]
MTKRAFVLGCGSYLPERVVPNDWFAERIDTSDEWIKARTGIERRHFAAEGEMTSDLGVKAAEAALVDAGIDGADVDAVILATATPDNTFPSTATQIQHAIGAKGFAFDVQAVCAGFMYALATANSLILTGQARTVVVAGAETFSRILDWEDRGTCVLFGDGAGAIILQAGEGEGGPADRGVLGVKLRSDGAHRDLLYVDGGPSTTGDAGKLRMLGREVFKHAVNKLADIADEVIGEVGVSADEIDWLCPHQANLRIIKSSAQKAGVPMEKVVVTVQDHGNTSAASIPLALASATKAGQIKSGDLVLTEGIGGGLAWGAALIRW